MKAEDRALILDVGALVGLFSMAALYDGDIVYVAVGWAAARLGLPRITASMKGGE